MSVANSYPSNTTQKNKATPTPSLWWNEECSLALQRRKAAFRLYADLPSLENWDHYKLIAMQAKRVFEKAKKDSFRNFCSSLTPDSNIKLVCKTVKAFKRRFISPNADQVDKNSPIDNPILLNYFQELGITQQYKNENIGRLTNLDPINVNSAQLNSPITLQEVITSINVSKKGKAPGPDGIAYELLKNLSYTTVEWLTALYNYVIDQKAVPKAWSNYSVVLIPKQDSQSFRPIALSCTLLKILEKIIADRLNYFMESKGLIPKIFFGFRFGKSCQDRFSILRTDIDLARARKQYIGIVFIDIKGAFNYVNIEILLERLAEMNVPSKIIAFVANIMLSRTLQGYSSGVSLSRIFTNSGCPQGSVLSPLLFNIYISKINYTFTEHVKAIGFADDFNFYASHDNLDALRDILTTNFLRLKNWLTNIKMEISLLKTRFLLLPPNSGFIEPNTVFLQIENHLLYNCQSVKYLGVQWDFKLSWVYHIQKMIEKGKKLINLMKTISAHQWGCHPSTLLTIFKGLLRPSIEWDSLLYAQADKKFLNKLNIIQNDALRIITGCFKTTPLNVLHHMAGVEPLEDRRNFATVKYLAKNFSQIEHMLFPKLQLLGEYKNKNKKLPINKTSVFFQTWTKFGDQIKLISRARRSITFTTPYESFFLARYIDTDTGHNLIHFSKNDQCIN